MIRAVFFDMNETLLNLSLLEKEFNKNFEDQHVLNYWFTKLLHSSTVLGIMDEYKSFGELAAVALENVFFENNKLLSNNTKSEILDAFKKLPAYDDVIPAFNELKAKDIRIVALSNSSLTMIKEQLTNAQIMSYVDGYHSVDAVYKYKPFSDVYTTVMKKEELKPEEVVMVATHDWDLFGAKKAGLTTAYIERKRMIYHPYYSPPDYRADSLSNLIHQFTAG